MWNTLLVFGGVAVVLLVFSIRAGPAEERHTTIVATDSRLEEALGAEVQKLRLLLTEQQRAAVEQSTLLQELQKSIKVQAAQPAPAAAAAPAFQPAPTAQSFSLLGAAATTSPQPAEALATVAAAERRALGQVYARAWHATTRKLLAPRRPSLLADALLRRLFAFALSGLTRRRPPPFARLAQCTEADVPILKLLRAPCPPGRHGYDCSERWDLLDSFLPEPRRWLAEFNASARAVVNCQRGFFDALADKMTRAHWEQEWDAQPFRLAATPPRTIGKMLHQIVTANYYHFVRARARAAPHVGRDDLHHTDATADACGAARRHVCA
eukprot:1440416-Prymnesium_polylepis.1